MGVNLAARIEAEGIPGSVLMSHRLYDEIRNHPRFQTRCLGPFHLKNVWDPVVIHALTNNGLPAPAVKPKVVEKLNERPRDNSHNLPKILSSFVGRKAELQQLQQLLKRQRLCTLMGIGGMGKTRLAIELGYTSLESFQDGIWFIDLASLNAQGKVKDACMQVFQLKETKEKLAIQVLTEHLEKLNALLIFDNCEHLIDECAELIQHLLENTEKPHFLATSRISLNIMGEQLMTLNALTLPGLEDSSPIRREAYESVALFIERAQLVAPGLQLDDRALDSIVKICSYLDGLPLAIELAAAKVRFYTPESLLEQLHKSLGVLHSRDRNRAARQQTLESMVDWSYQLLTPTEQLLFLRLCVFPSSFNLESIEGVCAGLSMGREEVIDLLELLMDKSLIVPSGDNRFRILEVIKSFGKEKLKHTGQWEKAVESLYHYFLQLAAQAYSEQYDTDEKWIHTLQTEYDNLLNILELMSSHPSKQLALAGYLGWYWIVHFHTYKAGAGFLQMGIENYQKPDLIRGRALTAFGRLSFYQHHPDAMSMIEESLNILGNLDLSLELAYAHLCLGEIHTAYDNFEKGETALNESVQIAGAIGNHSFLVRARTWLCYGYVARSLPDKAEPILAQNLEYSIQQNMKWDVLINRHLYADCALLREQFSLSLKRYKDAFFAAFAVGDQFQAAYELQGIAMSLAGLGYDASAL